MKRMTLPLDTRAARARRVRRLAGLLGLSLVLVGPVQTGAQPEPETAPEAEAEAEAPAPTPEQAAEDAEVVTQIQILQNIVRTQKQLRSDLAERQAELGSDAARGREEQLRNAIGQISNAIDQLDEAFTLIAAQVTPASLERESPVDTVELTTEIKELLSPLVSSLKRITARPREIDRLRTEIDQGDERVETIDTAISNLDRLLAASDTEDVTRALQDQKDEWVARLSNENTRLSVARQKLQQLVASRQTLGESLDDLFELFFKSRGRNLLIALACTLTFWLVLRRMHDQLRKRGPFGRHGPNLATRLFDLTYMLITGLGAVLVFMIVLYFFGDWVLLILVVLILVGLAWASKQALPRFWSQAMLLLDMGPVRDGERVIYKGLPFRIASLGLYSELVNPLLVGGRIRLPVDDLTQLRSRPMKDDEPFFPTREGDWVLLQDGTYGQVELQSTEIVRLRRAGQAQRTYPTLDFQALAPDVLSTGFLLAVPFGLDYRHQALITREIVEALRGFVERGIEAEGCAHWTTALKVEFAQAGASSLDLVVLWSVSGEAAPEYFRARRLLNRLCVDACNEFGWVIPFTQVTVHAAEGEAPTT